jgi:hypothetical protein
VSSTVTLHVWRVPAGRLPRVTWRLATDRVHLSRLPGVRFAKLLGTAHGFGAARPDPTRWAALLTWADAESAAAFEASRPARAWRGLASAYCRVDLRTLSCRGRWAGREPFPPEAPEPLAPDPFGPADGPVLALTRARLRPTRAAAFWRASRAPAAAVSGAAGLIAAFGIGEAPLGWQGTISVWRDTAHLVEFAYRNPDHRRVMDETPGRQWYAEELFARFAVLAVAGDHDVIGWCAEEST